MTFIQITEDTFVDPTRVVAIEVTNGDGKFVVVARHGGGAETTLSTHYYGWSILEYTKPEDREKETQSHSAYRKKMEAEARASAETFARMITEGRDGTRIE